MVRNRMTLVVHTRAQNQWIGRLVAGGAPALFAYQSVLGI